MLAPTQKIAPGIRHRLPIPYGELRRAQRDPLTFYRQMRERYGDVFRFDAFRIVMHTVFHPDDVKRVLQDNQRNYPRSRLYNIMKLAVGEGLVTSEGQHWLRQRRMTQPAFHRQRIAALAGMMTKAIGEMLDGWRPNVASGRPLDMQSEMMRLALRIVGQALVTTDISQQSDLMGQAVTEMMDYLNYRINHLIAPPLWFPTPRNLRFNRAIRNVDRLVADVLAERRQMADPPDDLLSMLLAARDEETGEAMTDRQLRDEIVTFIGAGHETTAVALAWTTWLLAQHPEVEERLRAEVEQVLAGRVPTFDDVPKLVYTRMVFEEAMRLYPPVWAMTRDAAEDDELGGFHIPKKSMIIICQWVTHRHPEFWDRPDDFDPDRFSPERSAGRPKYAYFPFAGGPHQCIGNEFALLEATLAIAMMVERYRLRLVPGVAIRPNPIFTLRPEPGVPVTIQAIE